MIAALLALLIALATACSAGPPDHRVLFIGNSYTHENDLPGMVETIAGANGASIDWDMIAPGGATLSDHLANREVVAALRSGDYDTVVFQEQSVLPSVEGWAAAETIPAAVRLAAIADESGVRVVWFQTWGRRDGLAEAGHPTFDSMQTVITETYAEIRRQAGGDIAPAGQRWKRIRLQGLPLELYASDGSHAAPAGAYAAAIEIAAVIIGEPILKAPSVSGVADDTALMILLS